jgi:hypothetical protein
MERRRKARVIQEVAIKDITPLKSPSPERKYLGLDKSAQEKFHERAGEYKGDNRRVSPTPDHYKDYNSTRDAHLSDDQLGTLSLKS